MPLRERLRRLHGHLIEFLRSLYLTNNYPAAASAPANAGGPETTSPTVVPSDVDPARTNSPPQPNPGSSRIPTRSLSANLLTAAAANAEEGETDRWPRLRSFLRALDRSPLASGPLKVVTSGLVDCVEIYEKVANNRKSYNKLRAVLENIFDTLEQFLVQADSQVMTASMESLCKSIQRELNYVQEKQNRGAERYLEVGDDSDDVLACYQRIHIYFQRLSLNVNISMWKIVDEQATDARLDRLCSSIAACYNSSQALEVKRGACTPGTRVDVLGQMHGWIHNPATGSVYWLNGMAGTGKTTIAYTLCEELDAACQLGASFFCSRSLPECRDVNLIVPSIAYQLAQFSRPFRSALSRVLEKERNVHGRLLQIQFESLIVKPLLAVRETLPEDLVVVIDALDECNNQQSTGLILDALFTKASDLPIKFFVSSRPEPEIRDQMQKQGDHRASSRLVLHELDQGTVQGDIETYLRQALAPIYPTDPHINTLVQRAGILFIYAATVVRFISYDNFRRNPRSRLETILGVSASSGDNPYKDIDELYTLILKAAIEDPGLTVVERADIKLVLYTAVCAREPLTINALSGLLGMHNVERVQAALRPLWSVLHVVETSGLVATLHASFPDYMFDCMRSGEFHCDSVAHDHTLASCCFDCIKTVEPRFNICDLQSSYVPDAQIPDLNSRVEKAISTELFYACRYWASHLEPAERVSDLVGQLQDFLSTRLLLWMEVMNLKKCMHDGVGVIQRGERWCTRRGCSEELLLLMHDAWRFVAGFTSSVVAQSTPHIYISMLPFWPRSNPIARCYAGGMRAPVVPQGPAINRRRLELLATWAIDGRVSEFAWSPDGARLALVAGGKIYLLDGLTGQVVMGPLKQTMHCAHSIGYSCDGTRIVCGSKDGTLRIWDAESGMKMVGPLKGHKKEVNSVAFSPDGNRVVSGSDDGTIRVWDVQSEKSVLGPLIEHSDSVTSVKFSPDGTLIISGSKDRTICVWNAQSGRIALRPLRGHTGSVQSIGFLPDASHIISGSDDTTIRVWDIKSGRSILGPLKGHTGSVLSVGISPEGTCIVSGSDDNTIRGWDIKSGRTMLGPLKGHTDSVKSVAFSPDGTRIISASDDATIRIWDIQSEQTLLGQIEGHTDQVWSVAFSPDGNRVVSGSEDRTIRVWDLHSKQTVLGPLKGHVNLVRSVAFSPDSARIVSGSDDKTILVWDSQSGEIMLGPLKGHTHWVESVGFSPDGSCIVSGSADRTIRVWDVQSGQVVIGPLKQHTDAVMSVCFSPDGTHVASGSADKTIRVWAIRSRNVVCRTLRGHADSVISVGFSPNGIHIISGSNDNTIRVWNLQSGETVVGPLTRPTDPIISFGFSPDGARIVSGSDSNNIYVWDQQDESAMIGPLQGHTGWVNSVRFSPNGNHIVSGSGDNTICVWDVRKAQTVLAQSAPPTPILWQIDSSGWVTDNQSRLLVWVPPDLHDVLLTPRAIFKTSPHGFVYLCFNDAHIGELWTECYQPV